MKPRQSPQAQALLRALRYWAPLATVGAILLFLAIARTGIAPEIELTFIDKRDHFLMYGLIGTLLMRALPNRMTGPQRWLTAFAIGSAFGLTDEILQHFNPGRTGDPLDWLADSTGALLGAVFYQALALYRRLLEFNPARFLLKRVTSNR